ncbi:DHA2 family efflux MFS transporter permease subunit (plasmid) [Deinococcus psychrotolerans]|uniref:DHA2 family efflux MFS transporter permease subunit n=1 Tax=Deinococcus psychrotolerans TaxID=2489213 RepID=A0A3G8YSE4_9DEIO|nr:DHA2 family efflux MFS transporter permease subunit [Deinococcus psychrotolerans]AZI44661.1 DHA2 family efflux MFS transporter permease subunit [Deinococcus psychrotolerans]
MTTASAPSSPPVQPSAATGQLENWRAPLLILVIGAFMAVLDTSIVNVALPDMINVFGVDQAGIEWVSTAYTLALGVITPLSGWLGAKFGIRSMYVVALIIFTIGSGLCALSWSLNSMIAFRIVQAIGGGLIMPAVQAMMIRMVPRNQLGAAGGIFGMAILLAPAIGPTLGGYLVEFVDWRWIFTINLPVGVLAIFMALRGVPNVAPVHTEAFDWWGAGAIAVSLFSLLLATSEGTAWGWGSESIVLLLYTSAISMAFFIWWQLHIPHPLLNLRLFKYRSFAIANILLMVISISLFGVLFYLPVYMQSIRGLGAFQSGYLQLPPALLTGMVMPFAGRLYDKIGPRVLVPVGLLFIAMGMFFFRQLTIETAFFSIIWWNCVRSVGMGLAMIPTQSASVSEIPPMQAGQASAITNVINRLGGAFGVVLMVQLFDHYNHTEQAGYTNLLQQGNVAQQNTISTIMAKLQASGLDPAHAQAAFSALLQRQIGTTVFTNTFDIVMVVIALALVVCAVAATALKKGKVAAEPGHAAMD